MRGQASAGAGQNGVDFAKTTFLVADDKAFFRDMVHTALMQAGAADVKHATTIETAIHHLNHLGQRIGCVICDWDMAPVGGLELLRLIRCRSLAKIPARMPVIFLTGRADSGAIKAAMALDVNGIAVAPLSFEKLLKVITGGMTRAWTLQPASIYGAVPTVSTTTAAPVAISGKDVIRRDEGLPAPLAAARALPRRTVDPSGAQGAGGQIRNVHMCVLADVAPGAILARDILDPSGHLLLKSGTELKPTLLDRLKAVAAGADASYHLWVGEYGDPR